MQVVDFLLQLFKKQQTMGLICFNAQIKHTHNFQSLSQQMFSKYKFGELIGSGSLGQVIIAQNLKKNKECAIKIVQKFSTFKKKCLTNVLKEKQILIKIKHPFIVNIEEAFQDKNKLYLVLQYMPLGDLRDLLNERKKLAEIDSKFIITCLLFALQYLSKKSIAHGDLKPQNILIDDKKFFRIGDFSSAYYTNAKNNKSNGTYGYISPEAFSQTFSCIENKSSDIYSLGVILIQMIYGVRVSGMKRSNITEQTRQSSFQNIISEQCLDFIQKTTCQNWRKRLTIDQAIKHPWIGLTSQKKDALMKKNMQFNPFSQQKDYFSYRKRNQFNNQESDCDQLATSILLQNSKIQNMFASYDYHPKKQLYSH